MVPEEQWSEPEQWAWQEIRAGWVADFNARDRTELDPKAPDGWGKGRKLRSDFLKEILFREPYRIAIPFEGVRIVGAWFSEPVDLSHGRLNHQLWLDKCRFEAGVDLTGLTVDGWLSLEGSAIAGHGTGSAPLNLTAANIAGSINANRTAFDSVILTGAKVGGTLHMTGATVSGTLTMDSLDVHQSLLMSGPDALFQDVDLGGAKIGGQIGLVEATVAGTLNMGGLQVGQSLLMRGPAVFHDLDLRGAKVGGQLSLAGATVGGGLTMNGLEVGQLFMGQGATFHDVDLTAAKVSDQLDMTDATVAGTLTMNGLQVRRHLLMRGRARFQQMDLGNAKIGGQLSLTGATVGGPLNMNGLEVGNSLLMRGPSAAFQDIDLASAKIGGQLDLTSAVLAGTLHMGSIEVGQHLFMRGATFKKDIELIFSRVAGSFDLSGAEFLKLDLSATHIEGELQLGSGDRPPPKWRQGARLILRNTHAGVLKDRSDDKKDAWPDDLELSGFTYDRLGGFRGAEANMLARDIDWYIRWLARDPSYAPQPYEQLAAVFRAAGEPIKADRILYENRERSRRKAAWPRWLGLSLLKLTIGYGLGLRYFRALWWVGAITLIGTVVLVRSGQGPAGEAAKAVYSLDQLLPIVELMTYDDVVLTGAAAYYFVLHKLIGWALGSFLVAGLAGLTQK